MIYGLYFSPTRTTEEIVKTISSVLSKDYTAVTLTTPKSREQEYSFTAEDTVVVGFPTYAGRIPNLMLPVFEKIKGNGARAIAVVTYGCRAYEDSLLELYRLLRNCGFTIIGCGAFPARHSFTNMLGADRPNSEDLQKAREFAASVGRSMSCAFDDGRELRPYYIPKTDENDEARQIRKEFLKAHPVVNPNYCVGCYSCVSACPMGSITVNSEKLPEVTGVCIKCNACVRVCDFGARKFDDRAFLYHKEDLEYKYASNNPEVEVFV